MGTRLENRLIGTGGTTVTALNSAAGGDAFTTVNASGTNVYDDDVPGAVHSSSTCGYVSGTSGQTANYIWSGLSWSTKVAVRTYVHFPGTLPPEDARVIAVRHASGLVGGVVIQPTGRFAWINSGAAANSSWMANGDVDPDTLYRVELMLEIGASTSTGVVDCAIYEGDSLTALKSTHVTNANLSTATAITEIQFGKITSSGSLTARLDDVAAEDDPSGYIGPQIDEPVLVYEVRELVEVDCTGAVGTLTLTQTGGEDVVSITGPTASKFIVEVPETFNSALTFDLSSETDGGIETEEIVIRPKGRRFVLTRKDGEWVL